MKRRKREREIANTRGYARGLELRMREYRQPRQPAIVIDRHDEFQEGMYHGWKAADRILAEQDEAEAFARMAEDMIEKATKYANRGHE